MFAAALLVCPVFAAQECLELTDNRGPYPSEEACFVRIEEMVNHVKTVLPPPYVIYYKCEPPGVEL
jgi:hypothetical protein